MILQGLFSKPENFKPSKTQFLVVTLGVDIAKGLEESSDGYDVWNMLTGDKRRQAEVSSSVLTLESEQ